jgi:phage-related protein
MSGGMRDDSSPKPLFWIGSSRDDLLELPGPVRREIGFALYQAQLGMKAAEAKPLHGFGGAGVLEVVSNHDGNTFRAVYTVRYAEAIFVLHAFQKKSKRGIATSPRDLALIRRRLNVAAEEYERLFGNEEP